MIEKLKPETAFLLIAIPVLVFFWELVLPPTRFQTTVHRVALEQPGYIFYSTPLSGGGIDLCAADKKVIESVSNGSPIVIQSSALFSRCSAVFPDHPINEGVFVANAARYFCGKQYSNIEQIMADYPGYTPEVHLWGTDSWFLPAAFTRYSVRMPDRLVILDSDGEVRTSRRCGTSGGYCTEVKPVNANKCL